MEQDISVNALLREYLEAYAAVGTTWNQAAEEILQLSARTRSWRGSASWTRDELHER